nr:protein sel-1-like protein 3 [Biomphalaria glabrata]
MGILLINGQNPLGDTSRPSSSHVRIIQAPDTLGAAVQLKVQYQCEEDGVVVVDLSVMNNDNYITVFSKAWKCKGQGLEGNPKTKRVKLHLPDSLEFRPDYFNKGLPMWLISLAKIRVWLVDQLKRSRPNESDLYTIAKSRDFVKLGVLPPYSRPFKSPACSIWIWPILQRLPRFSDSQTCVVEKERVVLLDYPAVFNGNTYGIIKQLSQYTDPGLERDRQERFWAPQLTLEMWVYIIEYCPLYRLNGAEGCGLFMHIDGQGKIFTPVLLINRHGNFQVDVQSTTGYIGIKTNDVIPRNVWTRIVFTLDHRKWTVSANYGAGLKEGFTTSYTYNEDMYVDDTFGLWAIGGLDWNMGSFVGYMGRVVYYRQRVLQPHQMSLPDPYHPMFELHLTRKREKCETFLNWLDTAVDVYQKYRRYVLDNRPDVCQYDPYQFFAKFLTSSEDPQTCPMKRPFNLRNHRHISRQLQKVVGTMDLSKNFLHGDLEAYSRSSKSNESRAAFMAISVGLIENATQIVSDRGLRHASKVVQLFKQAACLGNDDAMYYLAVMMNNGVGCPLDELQSLAYFMLGTLNKHVFSIMALGHRHLMGMDGAPLDKDVAYMYYKQVADRTRNDKEEHKETDVATEYIRLIDEAKIEALTSEIGDLFMWLKHQAEKGVATAQTELGYMLYHGAQGVKRNLHNALNVFRDGAQAGNQNAMVSYGLMQYRGLGVEANRTEGKIMLERAAEQKNPGALVALGWLALSTDKNYTEAFRLFQLSKQLGNLDSGYYLGHMYHFGLVPGSPIDLDKALVEYQWSAVRNQIDAGVWYAFLMSRGTPHNAKNSVIAVEWARFIGEKTSLLGRPLRDAVLAYRNQNYDLAVFLYLMLADAGLEVASFNLAYLCELNHDGVTSFISKDCDFRHYNLTLQREQHFVDAYSYLKMGDYFWYGCRNKRDVGLAADYYSKAAHKGNPQALFNLAYMVENNVPVNEEIWRRLGFSAKLYNNKVSLLLDLYSRCKESSQSEAFVPCCLAWFRIWFLDAWETHQLYLKITSGLALLFTGLAIAFTLHHNLLERRRREREEAQRQEDEEAERRIPDEALVI